MCERWLKFENFFADMGERPHGKSLERINNGGNYEPSNCRWATPAEQSRNTRRNVFVTINGETKILKDWADCIGIKYSVVIARIRSGVPAIRALTTEPHRGWRWDKDWNLIPHNVSGFNGG